MFSGMYIESRLWLVGCSRMEVARYRAIDKKPLEERLAPVGVSDQVLKNDLKAYRESRKTLVHEKPVPVSMDSSPTRIAQTEAKKAVALMERVDAALNEGVT